MRSVRVAADMATTWSKSRIAAAFLRSLHDVRALVELRKQGRREVEVGQNVQPRVAPGVVIPIRRMVDLVRCHRSAHLDRVRQPDRQVPVPQMLPYPALPSVVDEALDQPRLGLGLDERGDLGVGEVEVLQQDRQRELAAAHQLLHDVEDVVHDAGAREAQHEAIDRQVRERHAHRAGDAPEPICAASWRGTRGMASIAARPLTLSPQARLKSTRFSEMDASS